jgi:hypothetical protein
MASTDIDAPVAKLSGSITVDHVEPADIGAVWNACAHAVGQALVEYMPGAVSINDCREMCERNYCQLWLARDGAKIVGAAITEVIDQPQGLAIRLFLTDYAAAWSPYLTSTIEAWADFAGIKTIVTVAPPGLGHILGHPVTTYWRTYGSAPREVMQAANQATAIAMPSNKVH